MPIETVPSDGGTGAAQRLPAIREDASRRRPGIALGRLRPEVRPPTVIEPGRLIAGRHPCAWGPDDAEDEVRGLLEQGVTLFLDLTQDGELEPYGRHLPPRVRHVRMPIRDFSVPTPEGLVATLDEIDEELAAGGLAYVHCWAGCGRTGVVVGCWLVRHGTAPNVALARIAEKRGLGCPQTLEQRLVILGWAAGR